MKTLGGFGLALRAEYFVACRNWKLWCLLGLPAFASILHLILIRINSASVDARQSLSGSNPVESVDYAYGFFVDGLSTGFLLLYLLFISISAYAFAIDRDHGVARHMLIRQSSRQSIILAKLLLLILGATIACFGIFLSTLIVSASLWDFGPVVEDGYELISVAEIEMEIRKGLILALLPLPACLCLGLFLSVIANSALQAVSMALGISLVLDIFKGALGSSAYYFYTSFQPSLLDNSYLKEVSRIARGFSDILVDDKVLQLNYWLPLPQALLFLILTLVFIQRKNL